MTPQTLRRSLLRMAIAIASIIAMAFSAAIAAETTPAPALRLAGQGMIYAAISRGVATNVTDLSCLIPVAVVAIWIWLAIPICFTREK